MAQNPIQKATELGQSFWYDYIRRDLYQSGELKRLIDEKGLRGMTSNPTIFQQAIAGTDLYDEEIRGLVGKVQSVAELFEALEVSDVSAAADVFRPVYDRTGGNDGFVSIEVAASLARDTAGSIVEARRLWKACGRPNVMVKIPGTAEGIPAIRQCLSEGMNINVTLLFSVERHEQVMEAYLAGLEERVAKGEPIDRIRSVASFFLSRVDTNVDKKLDAIAKDAGRSAADHQLAKELRGKTAIGNARLAYEAFEKVFKSERFAKLKAKGAAAQRPLWASTSTKDPAYPDLFYVEAVIGPDTVDTVPRETFDAYLDHGAPRVSIRDDLSGARRTLEGLATLGIDAAQVYRELEEEGVKKFADSFDKLSEALAEKEKAVRAS